jgi:hypothetical protein
LAWQLHVHIPTAARSFPPFSWTISPPLVLYICSRFLQSWPKSRLISEGVALFGLAAAPDGGLARDVLLKFFLPNRPLPFHSFSQVGCLSYMHRRM